MPYLCAAALWLVITAVMAALQTRLPSTDVFLFKEPGVNLAAGNGLVARNLPHAPPDEPVPYVYYPPVFPVVYGVFSRLFGVGLSQNIVFENLLRLARALALAWVIVAFARATGGRFRGGWGFAVSLLVLALISSDADRPDELGALFALLAAGAAISGRSAVWIGACLGLCGASSPAAGVFGALLVGAWLLPRAHWKRFFATGAVALGVFLACTLPLHLADPGAAARFGKQASLSTFPYLAPVFGGWLKGVFASVRQSATVGWQYLWGVAILLAYLVRDPAIRRQAFAGSVALFVVLNAIVWTLQPYYLWFAILGGMIVLWSARRPAVAALVTAVAVLPIGVREIRGNVHGMLRAESQSAERIGRSVLEAVGGARLAVTTDQYFTFRKLRPVDNATYVCDRIERYEFVYVTPKSAARSRDPVPPFPCPASRSCFEPAYAPTPPRELRILGIELPFFVKGSDGTLFRNNGCRLAGR